MTNCHSPDASTPFARARAGAERLCAAIASEGSNLSGSTTLPPAIGETLRSIDAYRVVLPEDLGGGGISPLEQWQLVEQIAQCDASVGWNYAVGSGIGLFAGHLPRPTSELMFASPDACIAGSGAPQGTAEAVDGGYLVTGRFGWASGIDQARWVYGGCRVTQSGAPVSVADGRPRVILAFAPREQAEVQENWDTGGLRATGSKDFTLNAVFVPAAFTVDAALGEIQHPATLFRMPPTIFGFALSGVPLGIATKTVATLRQLGKDKAGPTGALREQSTAQYALARSEAAVEAARENLRAAFLAIWNAVEDDQAPSMEARARMRRAIVFAAEASIEAVTACYRAAGGSALFSSAPFEMALRDVYAAGGHLVFQRAMMEEAGRVGFGLSPRLAVF